MRILFAFILVIGLGLAGSAVYLAQGRFSQYQSALAAQQKKLKTNVRLKRTFVAIRKLKYGEKITKKDVRFARFPVSSIPDGAFVDPAKLFPGDGSKLREVLRPMEKGEVLLAAKVTKPGENAGVSSRLAKGMRAFAIRVDVASGVSGFLRPGDKVDVYWTGQVQGREITKLIGASVQLIAIDQTANADRTSPTIARTVTVEAKPRQVAALAQAQSTGRLALSLVGARDTTRTASIEINQDQLLGIRQIVPKAKPAAPKTCSVKMRKGSKVVDVPIPCASGS